MVPGLREQIRTDLTVGDVSMFLHKVALFEIAHKYAVVMSLEELVSQL
jgi:hypothetical protein